MGGWLESISDTQGKCLTCREELFRGEPEKNYKEFFCSRECYQTYREHLGLSREEDEEKQI